MLFSEIRSRSRLDDGELAQLIERQRGLFTALRGASVLLTGATGWFGTWLLDVLCAADEALHLDVEIAALSRRPSVFLAKFPAFRNVSRLRFIAADLCAGPPPQGHFTHIIHAATDSSSAQPLGPRQQFDAIIEGTRHALAAAGGSCRGFLLLSSGAIYGPARDGYSAFSEENGGGPDPASPRGAYAEGKRAAEQLTSIAAAEGVPAKIARCFAFVGPHMPFDRHFAVGNFIADAASGRPIVVRSDGLPERSYLYMTDLVVALLTVLTSGVPGRAYNVGSDRCVTIGDLARLVDRTVGGQGVAIGGTPSDPADRYIPDIGRLTTELGFTRAVELEAAVRKTADWYRTNVLNSVSS